MPTVSHRFAGLNWEKTLIPQATDLPFPRYACLPSRNFWIAWDPLSIDGQHEWSLQHPELECSNAPHAGSSTYKTGGKLSHNFGEITLVTSTV